MDIRKILKESGKKLYLEDLDFFETELATGEEYDVAYRVECKALIRDLRAWLSEQSEAEMPLPNGTNRKKAPSGPVLGIYDLAPKEANPAAAALTLEQVIFSTVTAMREGRSYKKEFKAFVAQKPEIDADFVDANYSFFQPWELDAIISVRQMGEAFLEKYFGALDHGSIARYQKFSEAFFMKHFSQLDHAIVLEHGKNDWRKKENRSTQLDVFLRLKGVKI